MSTTRSVLRLFWQHIKRYRWSGAIMLGAIVAAKVTEAFGPLYYKTFFDTLTVSEPSPESAASLIGIIAVIFGIHFVGWCFWRIAGLITDWYQPRVMCDLENTAFRHLMRHSYAFFTNTFAGGLVRKVHRLSRAFEDIADQIEWQVLPLLVSVTASMIVIGQRSMLVAGVLGVWVLFYLVVNALINRWKVRYDVARAAKDSEAGGALADAIANNQNVKLFTGYAEEESRFRRVTEELRKLNQWTFQLTEFNVAVQGFLLILIEFLLMYVSVQLWAEGVFTIGDFALVQGFLISLFGKLWEFGRVIRRIYQAIADAKEMTEILELPHEVTDARRAKPLAVTRGEIQFDAVNFNYHKTRRVLDAFSLTVRPQEKVALVGPSGAGKSTVVKLLLRFFDLDQGDILIDGQEIAKVTQESLWSQIALVPQDPVLFHRSLMDNIRYGRRDATDEEVREAARRSRCHEFISELPQGYDTFVGERGVKLSGGERQRVAIARAILKNAPILVLDEATSSLDSESESLIQDALSELMKDKTTIVIAHRLSTIMLMDRIVVVENGQVVDMGTHDALLKHAGTYKKLWNIQAGGFLPS